MTMLTASDLKNKAKPALQQKAKAAYLGLAIGDALGATVEFLTPREIKAIHHTHRTIIGGGWLNLKPGQVTDDTTMSLFLGREILARQRIDAVGSANAFDQWMRSKPIDIGHTVRRGILHYRRTGKPSSPLSEHDAGNGACMRVLPVALATYGFNQNAIQQACQAQAHVTHHNTLSDAGTECVVAMLHKALAGASSLDLFNQQAQDLVASQPLFKFNGIRINNPSGYIVPTLQAVFQALFNTETFEDCLIDVVNRGGDADTTGAIAGMIAGALYGLDSIPNQWLTRLDPHIKTECETQSQQLLQLGLKQLAHNGNIT